MKARLVLLAASTVLVTAASPRLWWNTEIVRIYNGSPRIMQFYNMETQTLLTGSALLVGGNVSAHGALVPWCDNDWEVEHKAIIVSEIGADNRTVKFLYRLCQDYRTDMVNIVWYSNPGWAHRVSCGTQPISKLVIETDIRGSAYCRKQ